MAEIEKINIVWEVSSNASKVFEDTQSRAKMTDDVIKSTDSNVNLLESDLNRTKSNLSGADGMLKNVDKSLKTVGDSAKVTASQVSSADGMLKNLDTSLNSVDSKLKNTSSESNILLRGMEGSLNSVDIGAKNTSNGLNSTKNVIYETDMALNSVDAKMKSTTATASVMSDTLIKQIVASNALLGGMTGLIGAINQTGMVSEDTAKKLTLISAGMSGIQQTLNIIQGMRLLLDATRGSSIALSLAESFRVALTSPKGLAMVGLAAGAVGVAGGALLAYSASNRGQSVGNTTTNTTNIQIQEPTQQQAVVDIGMVTFR